MNELARFFALPSRERLDLAEAVICLGLARLLLLAPFKRIAPLLGRIQPAGDRSAVTLGAGKSAAALAVRRALSRVAHRVPWNASCLVCAIAGRMMLRRRRMPSVLHLGTRTDGQAALAAHAWLSCGEIDVTGAEIADEYAPIAAFTA